MLTVFELLYPFVGVESRHDGGGYWERGMCQISIDCTATNAILFVAVVYQLWVEDPDRFANNGQDQNSV